MIRSPTDGHPEEKKLFIGGSRGAPEPQGNRKLAEVAARMQISASKDPEPSEQKAPEKTNQEKGAGLSKKELKKNAYRIQKLAIRAGVEITLRNIEEIKHKGFFQVYVLECSLKGRKVELLRLPDMPLPCQLTPIEGLRDEKLWSLLTESVVLDKKGKGDSGLFEDHDYLKGTRYELKIENPSDVRLTKIYCSAISFQTLLKDFQTQEKKVNAKVLVKKEILPITREKWMTVSEIARKVPSLREILSQTNDTFDDFERVYRNLNHVLGYASGFTEHEKAFTEKLRENISLALQQGFPSENQKLAAISGLNENETGNAQFINLAAIQSVYTLTDSVGESDCDFSKWGKSEFKKLFKTTRG